MRRALRLTILFVLVAAACRDDGGGAGSADAPARVAKIAVIAPLDAGLTQFGRGIRNSVELAVREANERRVLPDGWRLEVVALNDSSDPEVGREAAEKAAGDPAVFGVVGTYNSGVAAEVVPVLDAAGITVVSPANTDPTLTLGNDPDNPVRPHVNYFRMVASDNVQGPFLAQYAYGDLGARRVSVVSETKPVSKGLADDFSEAFTAAGGQVVSTRAVPDETTDYGDAVQEILPLKPDLMFYGGEYDVGSDFASQAKAAGIPAPVMGGDGLKDDTYIAEAGPASEGDYASTVGAPASSIPTAQSFLDAYANAGFTDPPSDYGVYAYDAANILIAALAPAVHDTDRITLAVREAVLNTVQAIDVEGASGRVAFDEFGDTRTKVLTVYKVQDGKWTPVKTETVS